MNFELIVGLLKKHEGSVVRSGRHRVYMDTTGHLTIGWGRNLTDNGISDSEATHMLMNDINQVIHQLNEKYSWFQLLDPVRQAAVVDMGYNLGTKELSKFRAMQLIGEGKYKESAISMLQTKWATQVKGRAVEISRIIETGVA